MAHPASVRAAAFRLLRRAALNDSRVPSVSHQYQRSFSICRRWNAAVGQSSGVQSKLDTPLIRFQNRHIGPSVKDEGEMLKVLSGAPSTLDDFVAETIPPDIRNEKILSFPELSEVEVTNDMRKLEDQNLAARSLIGCGYYGTIVPPVIQRNVLENPGWYTSYTPYQAEVSQGRLESLVNFQTMVTDMTGLTIANASILDEGTAAAEAMTLSMNSLPTSRLRKPGKCFVVSREMSSTNHCSHAVTCSRL